MLQAVLIVTGSGLVAFNHSFSATASLSGLGSLVKTIATLAHVATGLQLQVLEYDKVIVCIVARASAGIRLMGSAMCALLLDRERGPTPVGAILFGQTLGKHILDAFWDSYGQELEEGAGAHSLGRFTSFSVRIPAIAADAARAALREREFIDCAIFMRYCRSLTHLGYLILLQTFSWRKRPLNSPWTPCVR